jgi:hypothetical protein
MLAKEKPKIMSVLISTRRYYNILIRNEETSFKEKVLKIK